MLIVVALWKVFVCPSVHVSTNWISALGIIVEETKNLFKWYYITSHPRSWQIWFCTGSTTNQIWPVSFFFFFVNTSIEAQTWPISYMSLCCYIIWSDSRRYSHSDKGGIFIPWNFLWINFSVLPVLSLWNNYDYFMRVLLGMKQLTRLKISEVCHSVLRTS